MNLKSLIAAGLLIALCLPPPPASTARAAESKYVIADPLSEKNGADYIAVAPGAFLEELTPLLEKRASDGLRTAVITVEQSVAAFPDLPPQEAVRALVKNAYDSWERPAPKYLLLIGNVALKENRYVTVPLLPTFMVEIGKNRFCASDNPYADMDGDDIPDIAVGRITADSPEELVKIVAKIVDYETDPEPGVWRRRLNFFASQGGFGKGADSFLEEMGERLFGNNASPLMDYSMTYANPAFPYFYVPSEFSRKVLERFNEGSLITAYVGHGGVGGTAGLRWRGKYYSIMDMKNLNLIDPGRKRMFVFFIACLTGNFAADRGSLAEELLNSPTGPVGVFAASAESHTYSNALLSKDILYVFTKQRPETVGLGLLLVKRALMKRRDPDRKLIDRQYGVVIKKDGLKKINTNHLYMYNYLGDPATRIAYPSETLKVVAPERAAAGETIRVTIVSGAKSPGKLLVTLECEPTKTPYELEDIEKVEENRLKVTIRRNYANANNKAAARVETGLGADGRAELEIKIPGWVPAGNYYVKAYAWDGTPDAMGYAAVEIQNK